MEYRATLYRDFHEFFLADSNSARMLITELGLPAFDNVEDVEDDYRYDWIVHELLVFDNAENYALYELTDGAYEDQGTRQSDISRLELVNYIDLERFGTDLVNFGNQYRLAGLPNGKVVLCEDKFY